MKMNVLTAVLASAGLATSAFAQNGTFVIEVRLVVDGDPNAPIGAGITSYAPGDGATRVGLSLQARVTQTASGTNTGSGNYGIAGVLAQAGTAAGLAQFKHSDSIYSGGPYVALKRGQTGSVPGGDGLPQAGFFGGQNNPVDVLGGTAGRSFRELGVQGFGSGQPYVGDVNSLAGNAPGAVGSNSPSANGFITSTGITGLASLINVLPLTDPVRYGLGVASPWYNLYRVYFDPASGTEHTGRNVTVTFSGRVSAAVRAAQQSGTSNRFITTGGSGGAMNDIAGLAATFRIGPPIPAPAAGVLLGLGGLMAARRRRN